MRDARARGARASSATRPTRAPSGSRRPTSRGWPTRSAALSAPRSLPMIRERAPAKVNLVLQVGPRAAGRAARALLAVRLARPGRRAARSSRRPARRRGRLPGRRGPEPRGRGARARSASAPRPTCRRSASRSTSASRWPPGWAAAAPTPRRCCAPRTRSRARRSTRTRCARSARRIGADVPSQVEPAPRARHRRRRARRAGRRCRRWRWCWCRTGDGLSTARRLRGADRLGSARRERLDPSALRALAAAPLRRARRPRSRTTSSPRRSSLRPELAGATRRAARRRRARRARVTGSGPTASACSSARPRAEAAARLSSGAVARGIRDR